MSDCFARNFMKTITGTLSSPSHKKGGVAQAKPADLEIGAPGNGKVKVKGARMKAAATKGKGEG
jgi:hypothetical protein